MQSRISCVTNITSGSFGHADSPCWFESDFCLSYTTDSKKKKLFCSPSVAKISFKIDFNFDANAQHSHTVKRTAIQSIIHLLVCINTGALRMHFKRFILVQCLRYFSPEVISDKISPYSFKLGLHVSLNCLKGIDFCCVSSNLLLFHLFRLSVNCETTTRTVAPPCGQTKKLKVHAQDERTK